MRFVENGPDISDVLLASRDAGRVVLFCGAGLSRPAGLPDFKGLTIDLLNRLGAVESRASFDAGDSLDRVFSAMVKEFGGAAVDREVTEALRTPKRPELRYHRIAMDLSRNLDGEPQVVTTNFDLLFERAQRGVQIYVPPVLPDLALSQPLQGIVYLHGRLAASGSSATRTTARAGYVISSADFGRAYLAEGWASRFVRELRERYTIVLLGYSATDPPMRYLLEGLESREGLPSRSPIYTFAPGHAAEVAEEWRDRGVTAIAYDPLDSDHSGLWASLDAWAASSRDSASWRSQRLERAQRRPSDLRPFERGQIAHLVSSADGAQALANATPPPPAEWMCVFDAGVRYAKPARASWTTEDDDEIDPLDLFGLDDDPPRPPEQPGRGVQAPGKDLLRWQPGDDGWPDRLRLLGWVPDWLGQLPPRLYHLARWLSRVADQPAAVWWAARGGTPHPTLLSLIKERLGAENDLSTPARRFWRVYVEIARDQKFDPGYRSYEFDEELKAQGWTAATFRSFERLVRPSFEIGPPLLSAPRPPEGGWADQSLSRVAEIKVGVTIWSGGTAVVSKEALPRVTAIVRRSLERIAEMLDESTVLFWRTPTLHPTGEPGENHHHGRKEQLFLIFAALMRELAEVDVDAARRDLDGWDIGERYFFAKLFLYVATLPGLVTADRFYAGLLAIGDDAFWDSYVRRELLFALRARWGELDTKQRHAVERRIVLGERRDTDESENRRRRRRSTAATMFRWLQLNGRELTDRTAALLPRLARAEEGWTDAWAWNAADSLGMRGGVIRRITEPQGLEQTTPAKIVALAEQLSTDDIRMLQDHRPFDGLVGKSPTRALLALRIEARHGRHPARFWRSLLSNWPDDAPGRATGLLGMTLVRLPTEPFIDLRHYVPDWVQKIVPPLIAAGDVTGDRILDGVVAKFATAAPDVLESGIGFSTIGGVPQERSHVSVSKAINSPAGKLAETVFSLVPKRLRRDRAFPRKLRGRIALLLRLPGHGASHAACLVARRLSWIEYWDRRWSDELLPLFEVDQPLAEAVWHGLAHDRHVLTPEAQAKLKLAMLRLLSGEAPWAMDRTEEHYLVGRMVVLCDWPQEAPILSFGDARQVLMRCDDEDRAAALTAVAELLEEGRPWQAFAGPFLAAAWPRQLRFRSEATSRAFARIVEAAGDAYPDAVAAVVPFIRPVAHLDVFTYRLGKADDGNGFVRRYPASVLALLDAIVGEDRTTLPWNMRTLLDALVEAEPTLQDSAGWQRLVALAR